MGNVGVTSLTSPKAFISYSWTTPEHIERVRAIGERLMQDGVDIVLDQWELKPGNDAYAFMERTVTDSSVTKVIIITDKRYAEKANARGGGVGAESLIMSPSIYQSANQEKFGIVVTEKDDAGKAWVPTFLTGRIFFDFDDVESEETEYENLLRWLLDKPKLTKPKLGKPPAFLEDKSVQAAATFSMVRRLEQTIRTPGSSAAPGLIEYGGQLASIFREFEPKLDHQDQQHFEQPIFDAIENINTYVVEFRSLCEVAVRNKCTDETIEALCDVLEIVSTTMYKKEETSSWNELQFDASRYACYEMFISFFAILLNNRKINSARVVLDRAFVLPIEQQRGRGPSTSDYSIFCSHIRSFELRNQKSPQRYYSPIAQHLRERVSISTGLFERLQETDLILYLRSKASKNVNAGIWYPLLLIYAANRYRPFPLFARSESKRVLSEVLPLIGYASLSELRSKVQELDAKEAVRSTWDTVKLSLLINLEHLGTVP